MCCWKAYVLLLKVMPCPFLSHYLLASQSRLLDLWLSDAEKCNPSDKALGVLWLKIQNSPVPWAFVCELWDLKVTWKHICFWFLPDLFLRQASFSTNQIESTQGSRWPTLVHPREAGLEAALGPRYQAEAGIWVKATGQKLEQRKKPQGQGWQSLEEKYQN